MARFKYSDDFVTFVTNIFPEEKDFLAAVNGGDTMSASLFLKEKKETILLAFARSEQEWKERLQPHQRIKLINTPA